MSREIHSIFDFLLKLIIIIYGNEFLRYVGEERKIKEILKTEITTLSGKTYYMDFLCRLEDGTLCNIEFQYKATSLKKMKIIFKYNMATEIEKDKTTDTIVLHFRTSASGYGKAEIGKSKSFHPKNIYLGDYDFEDILNEIKEKVRNNEKLNSFDEINLLIMGLVPKYDDKIAIFKQVCEILKSEELFDETRFNLVKFIIKKEIDNLVTENKTEIYEGEIEMTPEQVAIINTISIQTLKETRMKGKEEGKENGENELILKLLKHETPLEISKKLEIPLERIEKIQNEGELVQY